MSRDLRYGPGLAESHLVLPRPESAAVLDAFALDDIYHGNHGLLGRNDSFDLPRDSDICHVSTSRSVMVASGTVDWLTSQPLLGVVQV